MTADNAPNGSRAVKRWRPLGTTGLQVTPIGLGLAALGRPAYINLGRDQDLGADRAVSAMEQRCHDVLDAASAAGIGYLDAARSYGRAETFLQSWFQTRGVPADAVTVGSKWGYSYKGNWHMDAPAQETKDLSAETLLRQISESRAELGDRLRLYQVHSATLESGVLEDRHVLETLIRLRSEGLVIGLTTTGPRQADVVQRALQVDLDGENPFRVVQATWNLLEPSCGTALAEAHEAGWGVIVKEALANGRLTSRRSDQSPAALTEMARALGVTADQIAIAAALHNPWADVVLSGAVTVPQLQSNVRATELQLSTSQRQALTALAESPDDYWTERATLRWA
jgi:aryl-alcohol dehydrogenase-like predicted oxidoreductase